MELDNNAQQVTVNEDLELSPEDAENVKGGILREKKQLSGEARHEDGNFAVYNR